MDAINAITQKSDRTTIGGASDEFKTVADGFAALLQLTGNKGTVDSALSAAESEFLRVDDNRDLVRDSHTLNNADSHKDDADDTSSLDDSDSEQDTRSADDDSQDDQGDQETSDSSDDTNADDGSGEGENQDAAAGNGENQNQPQVAGDGVAANLNVVEGAAAAAAASQVKTATDTTVTQATGEQVVQTVAASDANAGQTGAQTQQAGPEAAQQLTAVQGDLVDRSLSPADIQAAQTATAATQTQLATAQQNVAQKSQAQAQQGPQVNQERAQGQTAEVRSAAAQAQSQDLSQRLGDDARARVQVNVTGQQAAKGSTDPGQFNRFVGYNPGDSRTVSTANGQAGTGAVTNAAIAASDTPAEKPAAQTTAPIPTSATQPHTQAPQPGAVSAAARADLTATPSRGESSLAQSGNNQSNASTNTNTTTATQPTAQAGATQTSQTFAQNVQQTAAADRPAAPTSTQVIEQIKVNINKSVKAGMDRVTIQLRPENLGRIEVKMELSQDGKVRAFVTAESRETLDMLQRDARGLEKALQEAGLRTDSNNLHFALKSEQQADQGQQGEFGAAANDNGGEEELSEQEIAEQEFSRAQAAAARGGVDQTV